MYVLLVEDEPRLRAALKDGLNRAGVSVDECGTGEAALKLASAKAYDALVLDLGLPDRCALVVLTELRRRGSGAAVIILTARGETGDRVRSLNAGADDYLTKPFGFHELLARLNAIVPRGGVRLSFVNIEDLHIDLAARRVHRAGNELTLTSKEFGLLEVLALNTGHVVTRKMIAERVWGIVFDTFDNIIDVHIGYLRRKVDDPFECKLIHTHRGIGYSIGLNRASGSRFPASGDPDWDE